jgi:hypothetical protein
MAFKKVVDETDLYPACRALIQQQSLIDQLSLKLAQVKVQEDYNAIMRNILFPCSYLSD